MPERTDSVVDTGGNFCPCKRDLSNDTGGLRSFYSVLSYLGLQIIKVCAFIISYCQILLKYMLMRCAFYIYGTEYTFEITIESRNHKYH